MGDLFRLRIRRLQINFLRIEHVILGHEIRDNTLRGVNCLSSSPTAA